MTRRYLKRKCRRCSCGNYKLLDIGTMRTSTLVKLDGGMVYERHADDICVTYSGKFLRSVNQLTNRIQ